MGHTLGTIREKYPHKFFIIDNGNTYTIPFDDQWEDKKELFGERTFGFDTFERCLHHLLKRGVSVAVCKL